ncbi:MAG: Jag N-terminal domain-containing protein [Candidatus Alcyoniella australis]|nr:Jag N-terminal domain-containing protein [Candidatus Alcyoniella australis]
MKVIEKEGRTVDEAVETAAAELGVPKTKLAIEIVDVGTAGFFGMLARKARVRVTLKEASDSERESRERAAKVGADAEAAKDAGRDARKIEPFFKNEGQDKPWMRTADKTKPKSGAQAQPQQRPQQDKGQRDEGRPKPSEGGARRDERGGGQRRGSDSGRQRPDAEQRGEKREHRRGRRGGKGRRPETRLVDLELPPLYHVEGQEIEPIKVLEFIARSVAPDASITPRETEDQLWLDISAGGRGIFIGRKGSTLEALQFILNKIVRKSGGYPKKIVVDSEGYRRRRNEQLSIEAQKLSERVLRGRTPLETEPLSAFDRRIVHLALREDSQVTTRSLGSGEFKRVQILLADDPAARKEPIDEFADELDDDEQTRTPAEQQHAGPADEQPADAQPEDAQPEDAQPEDAQPEDAQPEDAQPEDAQPEDAQPEDAQPEDAQPEDAQPEDDQPEDSQPEDEDGKDG